MLQALNLQKLERVLGCVADQLDLSAGYRLAQSRKLFARDVPATRHSGRIMHPVSGLPFAFAFALLMILVAPIAKSQQSYIRIGLERTEPLLDGTSGMI